MVGVGLAFVCALVAWSAAAALIARSYRDPRLHTGAWVASAVCVAIGLSAAFPGALLEFSALTFRVFQIGVGLFGPLLLAWGVVEYAVASPRARFGTRLVVTTLGIVPLVVLVMDRLRGQFDAGYPAMADHYDIIPRGALLLVHVFAAVAIGASAVVAGLAMRERPRTAQHRLSVIGLFALAALLEILVSRFGLGSMGQVLMLGAVAALWAAFMRAQNPPRERTRRRGGRRRGGDGGDPGGDPEEDDGVFGRRRKADDFEDDYDDRYDDDFDEEPAAAPSRPSRLRGIITIYTLAEGRGDQFDDHADEVVEAVSRREPDTLLFACHTVPSAPQQRIVYAIYRDQLAHEEHEQQPHVAEFSRRTSGSVVATNVIELALSGASANDNLASMLMPR
ncbi:putative quinol monooxygenase [Nocardiopsis trehalosi]|jgi:quinol monooxygenase YgiN|uniref:putative quinol monooxygenase n=1 Tax=Nocardiopsis trehalosi TaxID=109329 RepID=UPI00082BE434|nr:antibiotic biosynthesis monooxygenase [Nocardiopsis trehalosi]